MAKYTFKTDLSVKGINNLINQLNAYKVDMNAKLQILKERLADLGVDVAEAEAKGDSHDFSEMVTFTKRVSGEKVYLVGFNSDKSKLHNEWYDAEGNYHYNEVSPIMMLEYGSAGLAEPEYRGSFSVTGTHTDDTVWYYYADIDKDGNPIHPLPASAEEPHYPMYKAKLGMIAEIKRIAKEVFG